MEGKKMYTKAELLDLYNMNLEDFNKLSDEEKEDIKTEIKEHLRPLLVHLISYIDVCYPSWCTKYEFTYKENVDDIRESPTLQLLEAQERHLARPLKVYDPLIDKKMVENQFTDFDQFIDDVDMVVIMVKHDHIKQNWDKLKGKVIVEFFFLLGVVVAPHLKMHIVQMP